MSSVFPNIVSELLILIQEWESKLTGLSPETITKKRNSQGRTVKQIVGHMVDSASNNTHRIVHLQYQESPISYPDYANLGNNDRWITIQNYQEEDWVLLVSLWSAVNRHIAHVIGQVDDKKMEAVWVSALGEEITLKEMVDDFPGHFRLHLDEIEALINTNYTDL
ncbi:MAG: DinB family protein [Bacteroidetes bacterium]|nr:DinB family protein [Bacteroidota bacterium]